MPELAERRDLVVHQRDQRADHQRGAGAASAPGSGSRCSCRRRSASAPGRRRRPARGRSPPPAGRGRRESRTRAAARRCGCGRRAGAQNGAVGHAQRLRVVMITRRASWRPWRSGRPGGTTWMRSRRHASATARPRPTARACARGRCWPAALPVGVGIAGTSHRGRGWPLAQAAAAVIVAVGHAVERRRPLLEIDRVALRRLRLGSRCAGADCEQQAEDPTDDA